MKYYYDCLCLCTNMSAGSKLDVSQVNKIFHYRIIKLWIEIYFGGHYSYVKS